MIPYPTHLQYRSQEARRPVVTRKIVGSIPTGTARGAVFEWLQKSGFRPDHAGSIPVGPTIAPIAQLVEQLPRKQYVVGSIPTGGPSGPVAQ